MQKDRRRPLRGAAVEGLRLQGIGEEKSLLVTSGN